MKIAILGCGSIGSYYGARLALGGHEVHFVLRRDVELLRNSGIRVRVGEREEWLPDPLCQIGTEGIGPCDLVIIALKSTQNHVLPELIPPLLGRSTILLTLQNGLGPDEYLASRFGPERVLGGLCFVALNRPSPGEVICYNQERMSVGSFLEGKEYQDRVGPLVEAMQACGIGAREVPSLAAARWRKLVWNVPFNGLGVAAGGIGTATILAQEPLASQVRPLMEEVRTGAAAHGIEIETDFLEEQIAVTYPMGDYHPSSVVDALAGREVEVEPIWGEPLRRARAMGVALPRLALLYGIIRQVRQV